MSKSKSWSHNYSNNSNKTKSFSADSNNQNDFVVKTAISNPREVSVGELISAKQIEEFVIPCNDFNTEEDIMLKKKYRMLDSVGHGAYGTVFRMECINNGQVRACKRIDFRNRNRSRMMKHLVTEVCVLRNCRHANIIDVYDCFIIQDTSCEKTVTFAYIVMEFASAGTMSQYAKKKMSEIKCREFFIQILDGLLHLHKNHVAHRDMKLENILLTVIDSKQVVKITDFGLAMFAYEPMLGYIEPGQFAGTRNYMAPEILRIRVYREFKCPRQPSSENHNYYASTREYVNFDFDPFKADIWALGVCLCEMATMKLPFEASTDEELLGKQIARVYRYISANISQSLKELMTSMLDPNPESRAPPIAILLHPWLAGTKCITAHQQ